MILRTQTDWFKWIVDIADGGIGRQLYVSNTPGENYSFFQKIKIQKNSKFKKFKNSKKN